MQTESSETNPGQPHDSASRANVCQAKPQTLPIFQHTSAIFRIGDVPGIWLLALGEAT